VATLADKERLDAIRTRHGEASTSWTLSVDGRRAEHLYAQLLPNMPPARLVTLTEDCGYQDRDFLLSAHSDIQFLLRLLADAFRTIRSLKETPETKKADFAAECAMKCDDPVFRRYLFECHQVDTQDRERIAIRVRSMLAISSRSELNSNPEAAARWKSLRAEFEAWRIAP
jgi:hypothetical protein